MHFCGIQPFSVMKCNNNNNNKRASDKAITETFGANSNPYSN